MGEVIIPERNKQKKTYPAEHMLRAWNRKHDSSFRFLCYQLITVKLCVEHLALSWVLLCWGEDHYSIQNSVSSEGPGLWNRGTDCSSWMIVFLFCFFLEIDHFKSSSLKMQKIIFSDWVRIRYHLGFFFPTASCGCCRYGYLYLHVAHKFTFHFFPKEPNCTNTNR